MSKPHILRTLDKNDTETTLKRIFDFIFHFRLTLYIRTLIIEKEKGSFFKTKLLVH